MKKAHTLAKEKILDGIIKGDYAPGDHLKEDDLMDYCGLGRAAVRQAIQTLVAEGLVMVGDNRRPYVSKMTLEETEQVFDLLSLLEPFSIGIVAPKISDEDLANLVEIQEAYDRYLEEETVRDNIFFIHNRKFHDAIHSLSGNEVLRQAIYKSSGYIACLYLNFGFSSDSSYASQDHWKIIDALKSRDVELAQLNMKMHIEHVRRVYRDLWPSAPEEIQEPESEHNLITS